MFGEYLLVYFMNCMKTEQTMENHII